MTWTLLWRIMATVRRDLPSGTVTFLFTDVGSTKLLHELGADYAAVRHILTSAPIAARTAPYLGTDNVDWPGLLTEAETMSGGERVLVRIVSSQDDAFVRLAAELDLAQAA
jgi:hypothetical protein